MPLQYLLYHVIINLSREILQKTRKERQRQMTKETEKQMIKEAQRVYKKEWRANHKENVRKSQDRYWLKKATKMGLTSESLKGAGNE